MASDLKVNAFFISAFERQLILRGSSKKTLKVYLFCVNRFLGSIGKNAIDVTQKDIEDYILKMMSDGFMRETVRLYCIALRQFFLIVFKKDFSADINLPKKEKKLPKVLSRREVDLMIDCTHNLKHRLIIMLMYSSGIRLEELVKLRKEDFDFDNNILRVNRGKGSKDRITIFSKKLVVPLRDFFLSHSSVFAFPGRNGKLSGKSVEMVVENAAKKAKLKKTVTPHMLRHSFATHLLESGVDISHIRRLLGHSKLDTTQIYLYVSNKDLLRIKSPLDS